MEVGRVIADRFEIASAVAKGGMGSVFRARDRQTDRDVAIKVLVDVTEETIARFEREGRVLAEIQHPSVVGYVGQGTTPDGRLWLAMDWIDGETLADRLDRGPLSIDDTLVLGIHVARAIGEAHARGLVHRDIKPSNLLLPRGEVAEVKVADFGIVHVGARSGTTQTGMLLGTPGYMAPEQARGAKGLDPRADVFSLGCVLFQCLTGKAAFAGEHLLAILAKILLEEAPRVTELRREVPSALADLVASMLAKDVTNRPRDGATVARLLEGIGHATPSGVRITRARTQVGEEEQRIVSVVLAGEPHGAANARTLSPEDHRRLAQIRETTLPPDSRFEVLADGTVLVAIWGRANARDQALQAVHAAVSMSAVMPDPVVVATGRGVVAGTWPVGEVIDRAARMLRRARRAASGPGVVVDQLTAGLLDSRYDLRVEGETFVVLREHRPDDSARRLCGVPTKCVGRERELRLLEELYAEAREEPGARAVVVTGTAGVGKSRVRQELLLRLAKGEPFDLLVGRGDPMRAGSPFVVLAHALRWTIGLTEGQPPLAQRMRLGAHLARWFTGEELQRIAVFLGEMIGVPPEDGAHVALLAARRDPVLMNDLRREAWLSYVRAATASNRALVIVLEDLHFGDTGTVALIDAALRDLADRPLFVLALARPEVRAMFPRLWEGRMVTEVSLGELSRKASERLVRDVLGDGLDERTVERVIERAGGNAFFLEELIRAVGAGDVMLPETVLATVSARLEALPSDARRVLRAGSVYGERFSKEAVAALVEIQVDSALEELTARELLYRRASSCGTGDAEYVFRHALVRDAAYAMLTADDLVVGHQVAGEWLEAAGEPDASVLAEHFERGGSTKKAIAAYVRAAEQALAANDFAAAIARAGRGIGLGGRRAPSSAEGEAMLDDGADIAQLRLVQSEAHRWRGELVEAEACARDAVEGLLAATPGWYRALGTLIIASLRRGELPDAVRWARVVTTVKAANAEAGSARVACLCEAGRMLYQAGRYDLAEEVASAVAAATADAGELEPGARVQVHRLLAARARHIGDLAGDLMGYQQVLDAFTACGDVRNACNARVSVGFAHVELGDWAAAEAELSRALVDAERMWLETVATRARQNLALVHAHAGRFQLAIELLERVIEESHAQGNARFEGWTRIYLSNVAHAMGDFARAEREAVLAESGFLETPPARAGALAALARARLRLGGDAVTPARAAMAILEEFHGIEEFESLVWLALIEVLAETRDPEEPALVERARARLETRAAALTDPAIRARFLDAVPENRMIRGHR
ncbi:MAG: protein kinase [Myxococcales bacterium]|nr:protein kinase [Myxococcales bacterium]